MRRALCAVTFILAVALPLAGQTDRRFEPRPRVTMPYVPTETLAPYSPSPRGLYQPSMTWYEFLLRQLNPHNRDYGTWLRERREALVDASIRNQYFWYAFGATVTIVLLVAALLKSLYDRRKEKRIMDDMMEEVKAHDAQSRKVAHEAIRRYNEHIELCNRAIEAQHPGQSGGTAAGSQPGQAQTDVDKLRADKERVERDNARLTAELQQRDATIPDLAQRVNDLSEKTGSNGNGEGSLDTSAITDPESVRLINKLRQELYFERDQNKRLKGGR
jgi:hypothetical protein